MPSKIHQIANNKWEPTVKAVVAIITGTIMVTGAILGIFMYILQAELNSPEAVRRRMETAMMCVNEHNADPQAHGSIAGKLDHLIYVTDMQAVRDSVFQATTCMRLTRIERLANGQAP